MVLTNQIIWFYLNKTKEGNNIKVTITWEKNIYPHTENMEGKYRIKIK